MTSSPQKHQQKDQAKQPKQPETESGITFLRRAAVLKRLGVGATTLFEGIDRGIYPPPVQFSMDPNAKRPISLWAEHEVTAAQQKLIAARDEALVSEHQRPARQRTTEGKFAPKERQADSTSPVARESHPREDRQENGDP
jgi:hypothetical protein